MTRETELKSLIVQHLEKTGRFPAFKSIGSDFREAQPVVNAMISDGTLIEAEEISAKGRKTKALKLAPVPPAPNPMIYSQGVAAAHYAKGEYSNPYSGTDGCDWLAGYRWYMGEINTLYNSAPAHW